MLFLILMQSKSKKMVFHKFANCKSKILQVDVKINTDENVIF